MGKKLLMLLCLAVLFASGCRHTVKEAVDDLNKENLLRKLSPKERQEKIKHYEVLIASLKNDRDKSLADRGLTKEKLSALIDQEKGVEYTEEEIEIQGQIDNAYSKKRLKQAILDMLRESPETTNYNFYVPYIVRDPANGWRPSVIVRNYDSSDVEINWSIKNTNGEEVASGIKKILSNAKYDIFENLNEDLRGEFYLLITADSPKLGIVSSILNGKDRSFAIVPTKMHPTPVLICPHAINNDGFRTKIVINNYGLEPEKVKAVFYDNLNNILEEKEIVLKGMTSIEPDQDFEGWIKFYGKAKAQLTGIMIYSRTNRGSVSYHSLPLE